MPMQAKHKRELTGLLAVGSVVLGIWGGMVYAALHFIIKYW